MLRLGLGLLFACGQVEAAAAFSEPAARKPLEIAAFAEIPGLQGPELSPNGKMIAAKVAAGGNQYFAVFPVDGGKQRLIAVGEVDLNWWRWVNDDWLVLGVGQLVPLRADDWYVRRAIAVNASSGQMVSLTTSDAGQNADDLVWVASDGTPRILMALQRSIYPNESGFFPEVHEVDVSTGKRKTVLAGRTGVWNWYADGGGMIRMGIGISDDGRTRRVLYRDDAQSTFRTIDRARTHKESLLVPTLFLKDRAKPS